MKTLVAQSGILQDNAQDCAIGALIGLHGQKLIKNNSDCSWGLI
jgi:hypothetical protein